MQLSCALAKDGDVLFQKRPSSASGLWNSRKIRRLDELVKNVFNHGEKKHRLRLRSGRTGNALKMAEQLGLKLEGTEAAHRVFSRHGWEIVIDFDAEEVPEAK